uniref:Uncharacterized protein n=1 Tax=Vitis vinifera TaxID=29760 RepID=F6GYG2_VITVI
MFIALGCYCWRL